MEILNAGPDKGEIMQRIHRYLGSILLGATLVAPMVLVASPTPQESKQEKREEKKEAQRRYYDRDHKVYHTWDDREESSFHRWMDERHDQTHRAFHKMKNKEQSEYWKWRHEHPDNDGDRH